jgi:hypothetical protein
MSPWSLSSTLLLFVAVVHASTISPFARHRTNRTISSAWSITKSKCARPCNLNCQDCINGVCIIHNNFCYINNQCYRAGQTLLNESLSCLQCQPNKNQTQWSFNPECSAGDLCLNPLFIYENICSSNISKSFYLQPQETVLKLYNFITCSRDPNNCQAGFFLPKNSRKFAACCPGYFCPEGQVCMIPCRAGSYCPSPLQAIDGICRTTVQCPNRQPREFDQYGCGGSTFEGFCKAGFYCPNSHAMVSCPNTTNYCPTGVLEPLPCPSYFLCLNGRARRQRLLIIVAATVFIGVLLLVICANISEWLHLKKKIIGQHTISDPPGVSDYFKKSDKPSDQEPQFRLNIHLYQAKLRNVTRFDLQRNQGFTGQITAGYLTALMGGSGCGKSSLLESIYGRRKLRKYGYITFAEHKPLSNRLTDYIGYVPQTDTMHADLTVFETVFYSARARRLGDPIDIIKNDVCFVLHKLGLSKMHNSLIKTLSGGRRNHY